jgi:hypothetical protein
MNGKINAPCWHGRTISDHAMLPAVVTSKTQENEMEEKYLNGRAVCVIEILSNEYLVQDILNLMKMIMDGDLFC